MASKDSPRPDASVPGDFADTVQGDFPASAPNTGSGGGDLPGPDSDIGLDFGAESDVVVAEKPTLSHIGRYALKSLLGEGGLGRVYEAWDPLLSRTVAVKTLQFNLDMPSRIALDRLLLNEARAAANLNHAHIVTVHDAGLSAHGVYIAMERLRGRDLRQLLDDGWRPSAEAAAQVVRRVADALAYAHARGVVHCDIKPGNIFLTRKERPKVLDFGIARAAHASVPAVSETMVAGSPHYMAPEQLGDGVVDARTDIYALGVVLYEMLCGHKAFRGERLEDIQAAVRAGRPRPLHELNPDLPADLVAVVERAMKAEQAGRFASASELSSALRQFGAPTAAAKTAQAPEHALPHSRRTAALALAGVATAALALGAAWTLRSPPAVSVAAPPPVAAPLAHVPASAPDSAPVPMPVPIPMPVAVQADSPATELPVPRPAMDKAVSAAATPRPAAVAKTRPAPAKTAAPIAAAEVETGTLQIAITPWGEVEVNGQPAGTTPPLTRLTLPQGTHTVTVRNADFPPHTTTVQVHADRPAVVRHRFGS